MMRRLDWKFYPHLFDTILTHVLEDASAEAYVVHRIPAPTAGDSLLRALRLTNHAIRDAIDRRIDNHAVALLQPRVLYTFVGKVKLYKNPETVARARDLDVHPGSASKVAPPHRYRSKFKFSGAKYARVFSESCEEVLDRIIGHNSQDLTVIYPVLEFQSYRERRIGSTQIKVTRTITLLPVNLGSRNQSRTWVKPKSEGDAEHLAVFLAAPGADTLTQSDDIYEYPMAQFRHGLMTLAYDMISSARKLAPGRVATVGLLESIRASAPQGSNCAEWYTSFEDLAFGNSSLMGALHAHRYSWEEWRDQLSQEEWSLIESIPGVCWDTYTVHSNE